MILPIYAYGQPVLKKQAQPVDRDYPELKELINDMWETMYHAQGVGLAAPQIGLSIRLFIVDTTQLMEEENQEEGIKKVFINAEKVEETGEVWTYEEGCLSIPKIRGDVDRHDTITLRYCDENFNKKTETFKDIHARVIQHEYDHLEGKLFVEKLKPLKKQLIKRRLDAIKKGQVDVDYRMKFTM
ncbi:MAG TPA: peptide deformylase [Saprospiraceae bacterium]|nr:peptide deformylase [Saprospiraceae bacterium]